MNIRNIILGIEGMYSEGGVSQGEIERAEKELNLTFAKDYKEYLTGFGCISFGCHEMTGLTETERLNVVAVTKENRQYCGGVPEEFYVIEETDMDGIVIWQNSKGEIYGTSPNSRPLYLYASLEEYIEQIKM